MSRRPPPEPARLAGAGVVLRPFTAADLPALRAAFADPAIACWNPGPADPAEMDRWMAGRNDWTGGDHASWAVGDPAGGLLGSVSVHQLDPDQGDAEIGYWIAPAARGHGHATAAVGLAAGYGFGVLGLRRIYLYHAVANTASCRVATAAGFRLEGTLRQSHRYADGRWHDEHIHGRLRTDPAP